MERVVTRKEVGYLVSHPWFAIQTRSRHERAVADQLAYKGYERFLPTYRIRRRWSDRMKEVEVPLFEGYLFCRLDQQRTTRVVTTPGVIRIVGIAGKPAEIEEAEVQALQQIVAANAHARPTPYLQTGQCVRITSGSLAGIEGILKSIRGNNHIVVSIAMLQRSVAVELDADAVCAADSVAR